ncbi:MAG: class I SAM-dependent methyltransferase [Micrococcaceae bacterium]
MNDAKFDGLAEYYDNSRPRYPQELFQEIFKEINLPFPWKVLDVGSGTGIVLEAIVPLLSSDSSIEACDISEDMVSIGRKKFPEAKWHVGRVEEYLQRHSDYALIVAGQSYQWLSRKDFLTKAKKALIHQGCLIIIQNNRNYNAGGFAEEYETLLETYSPGYSRHYRDIDVEEELKEYFPKVIAKDAKWVREMSAKDFLTMSFSSTQAQRAIESNENDFKHNLDELIKRYSTKNQLNLPYKTELFLAAK